MFILKSTGVSPIIWHHPLRSFYALLCVMWLTLTLSSKNRTIEQQKKKKKKKKEKEKEKEIRNKKEGENN